MIIDNKKRYLMIVESPNKVKTITEILKSLGYSNIIVKASVGHITSIKDSGVYNMGIDPDKDFKIDFKISDDKKDVVFKLKEQIKLSDFVILATDGDREGEAIAWSLKKFLNIPDNKYCRITYHEITKQAIQKALDNSTLIDNELVEAAHTRSCLDKIVGYRLSPLARQELRAKSVGRCQSAGLKLIVDREKEIINFKPELYYELYLNFKKNNNDFKAKYIGDSKQDIIKLPSKKVCDNIAKECKDKDYIVTNITTKEIAQNPPLPFITSTFQQEVSNRLGISVKDAMSYAQKLFEGIDINGKHTALITYIRSDDAVISDDFIPEIEKFINKQYGKKYYGGVKKTKKNANTQAGHEAIRVIDLNMTPDNLKQYVSDVKMQKIYNLIYCRTIASLMKPRKISDTQYIINNGEHRFLLSSKEEIFDGWKAVYNYQDDKEEVVKEKFSIPEKLQDTQLEAIEKTTQPPSRFTEASLIKTLDKLGIGRPSTYATIVTTLLDPSRNYCVLDNKKMKPTELAMKLSEFLDKNFSELVNSDYTANLEKSLDKISEGKLDRISFLKLFYNNLCEDIDKIAPQIPEKICPECGSKLVVRKGRYGMFLGCSNYPKCNHIEKLEKK